MRTNALKDQTRELYDLASPELLELFGPHLHDGYYESGREPRLVAQERLVAALADRAAIERGARVLDVGCGVGGSALWLARTRGCRVTGITNSAVQARLARSLAAKAGLAGRTRFAVMDGEALGFAPRSFDALVAIGSMAHLARQRTFLVECRRLLARGGRLAIADWMLAPGRRPDDLASLLEPMGVPELHAPATYAAWLEQLGWRDVRAADESSHIASSWGITLGDVTRGAFWRLVRKLGMRAFPLVAAARAMKDAIRSHDVVYAFVTARK